MFMAKRAGVFALCLCIFALFAAPGVCQTLGPAESYAELLALAAGAAPGDVVLVRGDLSAEGGEPLSTQASVLIRSADGERAVIRSLSLSGASVTFEDVDLTDTLRAEGACSVRLSGGVTVTGAQGREGISFSGNGALLVDAGARVTGGDGGMGIVIRHSGGDFYGEIGGSVRGGDGEAGGAGIQVASLGDSGVMMISGDISGGSGRSLGGHALDLYSLSGNAFVTVNGALDGGGGHVGGNGMEIVSASDTVFIGVDGKVSGGQGDEFGGDALMLMNLEGSSSVRLSGALRGGNVTGEDAHPGTSLLVVGDGTGMHASVSGCLLEDGSHIGGEAAVAAAAAPHEEPPVQTDAADAPAASVPPAPAEPSAEPSPDSPGISPEPSAAPEASPLPEDAPGESAAPPEARAIPASDAPALEPEASEIPGAADLRESSEIPGSSATPAAPGQTPAPV